MGKSDAETDCVNLICIQHGLKSTTHKSFVLHHPEIDKFCLT